MNQKIQKIDGEIERAKAKIAELQALLPELERKRKDLEDSEIIRLVRSANVAPGEIAAFVESIKNNRQDGRTHHAAAEPIRRSASADGGAPVAGQEVMKNEGE
jgi:hypothetical protein